MLLWNICETKLQTHCPRSGVLGYLQQQRTYCLSRQLPLQAGIPHCSSAPCASLNLVLPILAIESNSKSTPGWLSPQCLRRPVSCLILSIFSGIALSVPFRDNGLLFWVSDVLCQHSEVVLWNILNVQIFFWWICWGRKWSPFLFLCHLTTAPQNTES